MSVGMMGILATLCGVCVGALATLVLFQLLSIPEEEGILRALGFEMDKEGAQDKAE